MHKAIDNCVIIAKQIDLARRMTEGERSALTSERERARVLSLSLKSAWVCSSKFCWPFTKIDGQTEDGRDAGWMRWKINLSPASNKGIENYYHAL